MRYRLGASVVITVLVIVVGGSWRAVPVAIVGGGLAYVSLWAGDVRDARRERHRRT
jgi:hypothetical protein